MEDGFWADLWSVAQNWKVWVLMVIAFAVGAFFF